MLRRVSKQVFSQAHAWLIAAIALVVFLLTLVTIGNVENLASILGSSLPLSSKFLFLAYLPEDLFVQNTTLSLVLTLVMAALFAVNVAFFVHYIRRAREASAGIKLPYAGIGGAVAAALSVGCASCGTFVLGYVLALFGGGTVLTALPFSSEAVSLVGIVGLAYSLYRLAKEIESPLVCTIEEVPMVR